MAFQTEVITIANRRPDVRFGSLADMRSYFRMSALPPEADIARHALARDSGVPSLLMAGYMDAAKCLGGRVLDAEPKAADGGPRCDHKLNGSGVAPIDLPNPISRLVN